MSSEAAMNFPTGVLPWGKGVLITAAPDIFYAEDSKRDGICDIRKTLFTGFVEGNQQHRVNGLLWGLDNWVHGANGHSGGTARRFFAHISPSRRRFGDAGRGRFRFAASGRAFRRSYAGAKHWGAVEHRLDQCGAGGAGAVS